MEQVAFQDDGSWSEWPSVLRVYSNNFIYLFWGGLGLLCCVGFSLLVGRGGRSPAAGRGLLVMTACCRAPALEHRLSTCGHGP